MLYSSLLLLYFSLLYSTLLYSTLLYFSRHSITKLLSQHHKVMFNAQLALLPLLQGPTDRSVPPIQCPTAAFQLLFCPKVAAYVCDPDVAEASLELSALMDR
jgi:hypothetical protein